jgi:hypothetical protein
MSTENCACWATMKAIVLFHSSLLMWSLLTNPALILASVLEVCHRTFFLLNRENKQPWFTSKLECWLAKLLARLKNPSAYRPPLNSVTFSARLQTNSSRSARTSHLPTAPAWPSTALPSSSSQDVRTSDPLR